MASSPPPISSSQGTSLRNVFNGVQSQASRWFRHISEAADAYKARDTKNKHPDLPSVSPAAQIPSTAPVSEAPSPSVPAPANSYDAAATVKAKDTEENGEVTGGEVGALDGGGGEAEGATPNGEQPAVAATPPTSAEAEAIAQKSANEKQPSGLECGNQLQQPQQQQQQLSPGAPMAGLATSPSPSPGTQRRAMAGGGEPLRLLTEESPLIQPSEVVVSQRAVLTAQPVLTPLEKLRRKDEVVIDALVEKHLLVADLLHVPHKEFDCIADIASEPSPDRDINELLLAAIHHADQLTATINETLRVTEEEAVSARSEVGTLPCSVATGQANPTSGCSPRIGSRRTLAHRMPGVPVPPLLTISSALNSTLSLLMKHVKEREEERERLRKELQRSRELIHARNQNEQRLQWKDPDLLSSDSATEANTNYKGEDIEDCESGLQEMDLSAGVVGDDVSADDIPNDSVTSIPSSLPQHTSDGEIVGTEGLSKGKSSEEATDDPGGDVYVDALSYGETEVIDPKEKTVVDSEEIEQDSLECEVEPAVSLSASKDTTEIPENC